MDCMERCSEERCPERHEPFKASKTSLRIEAFSTIEYNK